MDTPASKLRREGHLFLFSQLPIGACFESNGNIWTKRTTRTANGIWPAYLPKWAYFSQSERTYAKENLT